MVLLSQLLAHRAVPFASFRSASVQPRNVGLGLYFLEFRRMFLFYSPSVEWFDVLLHQPATINVRRLTAFLVPVGAFSI